MNTRSIKSGLLFGAAAIGTFSAVPALAQDGRSKDARNSDDIIVTARRIEERLQDVPISITVFNQAQLDNRNITTATELGTYTPSLTINARFGPDKASFAIRGFSQTDTTSPTVGVYFADVVALRAAAGTTSGNGAGPGMFFDLQNVQVLKGPQGTLFGRNTTGGAILLVPQRPKDKFEGYIEGSTGSYNLKRVQAVVNVPLSDSIRARIGVDRQDRDGYMRNQSGIGPKDFADSNYVSVRAGIVADLSPDLENYLLGRYSHSNTHGMKLRLTACNDGTNPAFPLNARSAAYAVPGCAQLARQNARGDGFYDIENDVTDPFNILEEWQVINTTTWQASDNLTVKNIISYGQFHEQFWLSIGGERLLIASGANAGKSFPTTVIRNAPGQFGAAQSTFSEELQLQGNTGDGKLVWQAGAYYESSKPLSGGNTTHSESGITCVNSHLYQCENIAPAAAGGALGVVKNAISFRNIGFYGQGTYNFSDKLAFTAGLRYTIDRTVGSGGRLTISFPTPNTPTGRCANPNILPGVVHLNFDNCVGPANVSKSSKPTWLFGLDYKPVEDVLLYAKYTRGYRQGGVNPSNIGLETWEPESVDTYELGAKTSFSGKLTGYLNIAAFWNDFTNQQLSVTVTGKPGSGIPGARVIVNAGKSRIKGIEVDAAITPFEGFKIEAGYAYLDTQLLQFVPRTLPANSPFLDPVFPALVGKVPLPFSPSHRFTLTGSYTLPIDKSIGELSVGATFTNTTSQVAADQSPFGIMPSNSLLNFNVNWNGAGGTPVDLAFFITNITGQEFPVNVANNWTGNGIESYVTNVPRMWGVRLKYRFGS